LPKLVEVLIKGEADIVRVSQGKSIPQQLLEEGTIELKSNGCTRRSVEGDTMAIATSV
jgi:hypothetical protein